MLSVRLEPIPHRVPLALPFTLCHLPVHSVAFTAQHHSDVSVMCLTLLPQATLLSEGQSPLPHTMTTVN